ncbi:MAG: metallophosphoesterase family protein, partial [Candidatus Thorarchaeota archaeon]
MKKIVSLSFVIIMLLSPAIATVLPTSTINTSDFIPAAPSDVFLRGPTVHLVTNDSAKIFWRTDSSSDATVDFGLNTSLMETVTNATLDTDHMISLAGLEMGTKYYYRATSGADESQIYHFLTAPADGEEFKLIIAGDNRPDGTSAPTMPEEFSQLVDLIVAEEPHLIVLTGDYIYRLFGNHAQDVVIYGHFTDILDIMGHYAPIVAVLGNHDSIVQNMARLMDYFHDAFVNVGTDETYFSFDYAGAHFTMLDSEELGIEHRITGTQYDWLVNDLSTSSAALKFVFSHQPLYPVRHIRSALDVNKTERDRLQQLFEDENVTLYGAGHDHTFDRLVVNDVVHLITGGLGAPLGNTAWGPAYNHYTRVMVSPNSVDIKVIKPDESIGAEYALPYDGPIEIAMRITVNNTAVGPGTDLEIYFSTEPAEFYYSWDGATNSTTLASFPEALGVHTLDVYAKND